MRQLTLASGMAAALWGLLIILADSGQVHFLGIRLSSRHPFLLFWGGIALLAVYAWRWRPSLGRHAAALASLSRRQGWVATALVAAAVCAASFQWGSTVAGGSDSYGYVSQAGLWRTGDLLIRGDIIRQSPWPMAIDTWAPLGHRPAAGRRDAIAPVYPPGLPMLMALFQLAFGYCGAFYVVPIAGAVAIILTYALGLRLFDRPAPAFWAALLVATSPVFLFQSMNPMTDIPSVAMWTLALLFVVAEWPLAAGVTMAVALAVRPNLLPVAMAVWLWCALTDWRASRVNARMPTRTLRLAVGLAPAVAGLAWFNTYLYGSPLASGYGTLDHLYSPTYAWRNVSQFATWVLETQTPIVLASPLFFVAPRWIGAARIPFTRVLIGGVMLAVVASYIFYSPFETWTYLRFLLPMWPLLMLTTALALEAAAGRWPERSWAVGPLIAVACVALAAGRSAWTAIDRGTFHLWRGEQRYLDVARYLAEHTEPRAVILSYQHSGSIRQYGGRLTLRWDQLHPAWLDRAVEYLVSTGRHPYIVVDVEEVEPFMTRFRKQNRLGALDWTAMAVLGNSRVAVFDASERHARRADFITDSGRGRAGWRCRMPPRWPPANALEAP